MAVTVGITRDDGQRHGAVVLGDVGSRIAAVAVIDEAAAHAGGVLHASHGAVDVVVALQGAIITAHDGTVAVVVSGGDGGAGGEVVGQDAATVIKACYGAEVPASGDAIGDGEDGGAGAVADGAETRIIGSTVLAYDAADFTSTISDGDGAEDVAAGDGAAGVSAYDATGAAIGIEADGVGDGGDDGSERHVAVGAVDGIGVALDGSAVGAAYDVVAFRDGAVVAECQLDALAVVGLVVIDEAIRGTLLCMKPMSKICPLLVSI